MPLDAYIVFPQFSGPPLYFASKIRIPPTIRVPPQITRVVYRIDIFPVSIGWYSSVFTIPIPKEISVGTFWYHFFHIKGALSPLLREKGGTGPLFDTASPPFAEKRSSCQTSNTDQNTNGLPS